MIFTATAIPGAFILEIERREDERGFFARTFCVRELEAHGLSAAVAQCSISYNRARGTLRGMHWQDASAPESKLVRCTRGAILDVIVDLRRESPAYGKHVAVELNAENRRGLFIPPLCAHGFQTLRDDAEVFYQIDQLHSPAAACGLPYDDPAFGIAWPLPVTVIAEKDRTWPRFAL